MLYVAAVNTRELIKNLEDGGWRLDRVRGSHHVFVHDDAMRSVVVPVHGKEIPDFFAKAILKQASDALRRK
jgi:predicted RNA binding protein YcfA (HicA-like mRNA interferase family)